MFSSRLHIICERDAGLFSLIQQVIANIPWAIKEGRLPVVYFRDKTAYWIPMGYRGRDTVWEYYFEPLIPTHPATSVPAHVAELLFQNHPAPNSVGYRVDGDSFASSHFGDHPALKGKTLSIPYLWDDPNDDLRREAAEVINRFIRPRRYLRREADRFFQEHLHGDYVIGVHVRGTDASSRHELRAHRYRSLCLSKYTKALHRLLEVHPKAKIFLATDAQSSLDHLTWEFGDRVHYYNTIRHSSGQPAAAGPTGQVMPAYVASDSARAAQNGKEAIIDYLLLSRCDHLVHNGSGLARTVLLNAPQLPHSNTHRPGRGLRAAGHIRAALLTRMRKLTTARSASSDVRRPDALQMPLPDESSVARAE